MCQASTTKLIPAMPILNSGGSCRPIFAKHTMKISATMAPQRAANVHVKRESEIPRKRRIDDDNEVTFLRTKKRKTEQDFHRQESKRCLDRAKDFATEGNKEMMDYCLENARSHCIKAGEVISALMPKTIQIRQMLNSESHFHAIKIKEQMKFARDHAAEGNREMMDYALDNNAFRPPAHNSDGREAAFLKLAHRKRYAFTGPLKFEHLI